MSAANYSQELHISSMACFIVGKLSTWSGHVGGLNISRGLEPCYPRTSQLYMPHLHPQLFT